ncbi:MAG: hypothetical protein ACFFCZ_21255 [Promethearchaeota archaeon]
MIARIIQHDLEYQLDLALKGSPIIDRSLLREPLRVDSAPSSFFANPTASRQCLVQGASKVVPLNISHN